MKRHPKITLSHWTTPATNREHGISRRLFRWRAEQQRIEQKAMRAYVERFERDFEEFQRQWGDAEMVEPKVVVQ